MPISKFRNPTQRTPRCCDDWEVVRAWLESLSAAAAGDRLRELLDWFRADAKSLRIERLPLAPGENAGEYFLVVGKPRPVQADDDAVADDRTTSDDSRSSFTGVAVTLADHLAGVADRAAAFAERLGLAEDIVADLRLRPPGGGRSVLHRFARVR